ncbi:MAG: Do family serine endopeptidase [Planctomycetia bacterium]|nr:Do family serine endopeptidase [Planctomycetia bacterium]
MERTQFNKTRWGLAAAALAAIGGGWSYYDGGALGIAQAQAAQAPDTAAIEHAEGLSKAFRTASEIALPTVVTIRSETKAKTMEGASENGENPFRGTPFEDFFRDNPNFKLDRNVPRQSGLGSGVIIDKSGIILTNNHVVEGADEVTVELSDGRVFKGTDIKVDPDTDLAVVHIKDAGTLPAAKLGDSDAMEIGDWVIAVGNPFGLEQTVSAGIISGKGRLLGQVERANFLQTDAAINPGNSGGPLVNLRGEVVGINTAIASNSGGYQGIGFAVPISLAKWVAEQLSESGTVARAYLGVGIQQVDADLAQQLGIDANGVIVSEVYPDTPAAEAGLKDQDVIVEFAGKQVHDPRELQGLVERAPLGSKQEVKVVRDGKTVTLAVTAQTLPKNFGRPDRNEGRREQREEVAKAKDNPLGIEVADLDRNVARQLNFEGFEGVVITHVEPESLAAEAGLQERMLVLKVGKTPVTNVAEFEEAVNAKSLKEGVMLQVRTERGNRYVVLKQD